MLSGQYHIQRKFLST